MDHRAELLRDVLSFVRCAVCLPGVYRVALIGSLTTDTPTPKDSDLLVTVSDDMSLGPLAKAARRMQGLAQSRGQGAEVFLTNEKLQYIGRICPWKDCRPFIRQSCDALNCGLREYLHDDLRCIRLPDALIAEPPLELWPVQIVRTEPPEDVRVELLVPLLNAGTPERQSVSEPNNRN